MEKKVLDKVLDNKKNRAALLAFVAIMLCFICILVMGLFYLSSVRQGMLNQATANVLSMTQQHQVAFSNFIELDRERLHSFAVNFAEGVSTDSETIESKLTAFNRVDAVYVIYDIDHGLYYSNYTNGAQEIPDDLLEVYSSLQGSGIRKPYQSMITGNTMFGYYESFRFADGKRGLLQKGYDSSRVSAEFSLSFYNDQGFAFVTDTDGEVLLRSTGSVNGYAADNVLELISSSDNSAEQQAECERLRRLLAEHRVGTETFHSRGTQYVYTFVPVSAYNEWYLISIVPYSAMLGEANQVVNNSQVVSIVLVLLVGFLGLSAIYVQHTTRNAEKKERAIRYHEQRFSTLATFLANNTDDVYIMMDHESYAVEFISPNIFRVLGISEEEVSRNIGVLGYATYINNDAPGYEDLHRLVGSATLGPFETERINPQTGMHCWFLETVYAVNIQDQEKIVTYISNRTSEHETQEALSSALETARVANKSKSSFLSSMSHDIRTPLNAIIGLIVLLQQDAHEPDRVIEYAQRMSAASQHLLALINDILDMNKIESGSVTLNIADFNMAEVIDEIVSIIRPQTKAKRQEFKISISQLPHEHLCGDKMRINQVLINLLSNAVKYTQTGGSIEIAVCELPQVVPHYSHIQFRVADNGMGMSEDYLNVIFDPFTREKDTLTNKIQGTGLGMAITKNLVDLMGGAIHVESEKGKGSVFTVELDLRVQDGEVDTGFWKQNNIRRMIVVDNEEDTCRHVVTSMLHTGVEVLYETEGQKALTTISAAREAGNPFDLILLDWKMPGLSGLETARLIRQNYSRKIPILIFTAYDWEEIEDEASEIGIDHFVPKPFFLSNFTRAVEKVMGSRKMSAAAAAKVSVAQGKRFMIVEDIDVNRLILNKILTNCGAECVAAENGKEAVDLFLKSEAGTYDMILMDVQMPVMNGYDATRAIRASEHPEASTIPIVAMTANAFADDVRDALDSGMDAHIAKPIVLEQLEQTMRKVFEEKERRADS